MLPVLNRSSVSLSVWTIAAEVVGHLLGQREDRLGEAEVAEPGGQVGSIGGDDLAEPVPEVGLDAGVATAGRRAPRSPAYVARTRLVRHRVAAPTRASSARCHISLTGLPIALRDLGGLERGVEEEPAAEGAAALHDVDLDLVLAACPSASAIRCCAVIGDFSAGPDLGPVGAHVGDRGVGVHRGVAAEVEDEVAARRSARAGCPGSAGSGSSARPAARPRCPRRTARRPGRPPSRLASPGPRRCTGRRSRRGPRHRCHQRDVRDAGHRSDLAPGCAAASGCR